MRTLVVSHALAASASAMLRKEDPADGEKKVLYTVVSVALVVLAGLMSGLTLGLMSLDSVDLEVLRRSGTETEKKHAARIAPVVKQQHLLLVTLLLMNAAAMEALPIFIDKLTDPITAIVLSVTVVLAFGEIIPQAVCSRYGLAVGSYSAWLVRALMFLCWPIAWPISKLLDYLLGAEHSALFRRGQLKALVDVHSTQSGMGGYLTPDEISVIRGALDLTSAVARQAMTSLDKVFMLSSDSVLDHETLARVLRMGHSRVPVHAVGDRTQLLGVVLVKELVLLDPDDQVRVDSMRIRQVPFLGSDTPMYDLLRLFQTGRSHMVFLRKPRPWEEAPLQPRTDLAEVSAPGSSAHPGPQGTVAVTLQSAVPGPQAAEEELSPYEARARPGDVVGIITIEDVVEELIGAEIIDETDTHVDNERKERVNAASLAQRLPESLRTALRMNNQAGAGTGRPRVAQAGRPRSATGPPQPLMSRGNSGAGLPEGQHAAALAEKAQLRRASTSRELDRKPDQLRRSYTDEGDVLHEPLLSGPGSKAGDADNTGGGGSL